MNIIDVDLPDTWLEEVHNRVAYYARRLEGSSASTLDLDISFDEQEAFREELAGTQVKVYHATRLLDHEVESIRAEGLIPLSADLVRTRIKRAAERGALSQDERDELLAGNLFDAGDNVSNREGQVCFFLSVEVLSHSVSGVWNLMTKWGGEGIYFGSFSDLTETRLKLVGRPSVVVAAVDLSPSQLIHPVYPGVLKSFVGRLRNHEDYAADVLYKAPVPPVQILDIWQPGHPEYDRFQELPEDLLKHRSRDDHESIRG